MSYGLLGSSALLLSPLTDWKIIVNNEAVSLYQTMDSWIYLYIYGK